MDHSNSTINSFDHKFYQKLLVTSFFAIVIVYHIANLCPVLYKNFKVYVEARKIVEKARSEKNNNHVEKEKKELEDEILRLDISKRKSRQNIVEQNDKMIDLPKYKLVIPETYPTNESVCTSDNSISKANKHVSHESIPPSQNEKKNKQYPKFKLNSIPVSSNSNESRCASGAFSAEVTEETKTGREDVAPLSAPRRVDNRSAKVNLSK
jgi:hypothetical protein